jgi:hypothetical protein
MYILLPAGNATKHNDRSLDLSNVHDLLKLKGEEIPLQAQPAGWCMTLSTLCVFQPISHDASYSANSTVANMSECRMTSTHA